MIVAFTAKKFVKTATSLRFNIPIVLINYSIELRHDSDVDIE